MADPENLRLTAAQKCRIAVASLTALAAALKLMAVALPLIAA